MRGSQTLNNQSVFLCSSFLSIQLFPLRLLALGGLELYLYGKCPVLPGVVAGWMHASWIHEWLDGYIRGCMNR